MCPKRELTSAFGICGGPAADALSPATAKMTRDEHGACRGAGYPRSALHLVGQARPPAVVYLLLSCRRRRRRRRSRWLSWVCRRCWGVVNVVSGFIVGVGVVVSVVED